MALYFKDIATLGELQQYLEARFTEIMEDDLENARHDLYGKANRIAIQMREHTDFDYMPMEPHYNGSPHDVEAMQKAYAGSWLYRQRPNESQKIRDYRISIYEPITASLMAKPFTFLSRLFNPKLSGIDYPAVLPPATEGREISAYLDELRPFSGLTNWLKERFLKFGIVDPNGFIVVRTAKSDAELATGDLPEPKPYCVPSSNVVAYEERTYLITHSTDKSPVITKKSSMPGEEDVVEEIGDVFFVYTPDVTFRIIQVGEEKKKEFLAEVWNLHNLGFPAFVQAGGDVSTFKQHVESVGETVCYQSFFQAIIPHLNELAGMHNDQQAAFILRIFLEKYEKVKECTRCEGSGQVVVAGLNLRGEKKRYNTCPACNGAKYLPATSVFDVYGIKGQDPSAPLQAPAGYVEIPTDIVKTVEDKLKEKRKLALASIFMETLEGEAGKLTTAVGLEREREGLYALLENISMNAFARVGQFVADAINGIRYGVILGEDGLKENRPFVRGPINFNIRGLSDILVELEKISQLGVPKSMRLALQLKLAKQSHGPTSFEAMFIETELLVDPLAGMSEDEILTANSVGIKIEKLDLFKHVYAVSIIHECLMDRPDFLTLPDEEKKEIFDAKAQEKFEEIEENLEPDPDPDPGPTGNPLIDPEVVDPTGDPADPVVTGE